LLTGFEDVSLLQLALVAGVALVASLIGGVAGYGTGALVPLVLVPMIGPGPVVPILALSALLTNTSRTIAYRAFVDWKRSLIVLLGAAPPCAISAYGYTLLTGKGAQLVIGTIGAGVILLSLLMAAGVQGMAVIATDAVISIAIGVVRIAVFGTAGAVDARVIAFALLIGVIAFPGAFLAKAIAERMPLHVHTAILDAVVLVGGLAMIVGAFTR
jgi:uncharacterized membrane protein YfcA